MTIEVVEPDLINRLKVIFDTIGHEIRGIKTSVNAGSVDLPPWLLNIDYEESNIDPALLANLFSGFTQENTGQHVLPVDILLSQKDGVFDITFVEPDILADPTLNSAILISLFTDKRANNKNGWWGDDYLPIDDDEMGGLLWLLKKAKPTPETLRRAEGYAKQALKWMIDDKHLEELAVSAHYEKPSTTLWLVLDITGKLKDGSYYQQAYRLVA